METTTINENAIRLNFFSRTITLSDLENSDFMRYANEDILADNIDLDASFNRVMAALGAPVPTPSGSATSAQE